MSRFEPPTIKQRGQLARTMNAAYQQKPKTGTRAGQVKCERCAGTVRFTIDAAGRGAGRCNSNCGVRWPL